MFRKSNYKDNRGEDVSVLYDTADLEEQQRRNINPKARTRVEVDLTSKVMKFISVTDAGWIITTEMDAETARSYAQQLMTGADIIDPPARTDDIAPIPLEPDPAWLTPISGTK